ncbi:MAG TPA: copper resistance CopC family protein [Candidatus Methylomirabilis sp.]|nr:copper resistance CopC family protein [Candidatus Methylomirabilis sp.]HSB81547.1 copper resistance CopC family protein [Candidatus Methylomirabilis sp.]
MKSVTAISLVLAALLVWAAGAGAHAFLERADPRVGSSVRAAPAQVRLWFTERLEPAFSSVRVVNETGNQVDKGDGRVDSANPALLQISLAPLPPGTYKVIWRVLSVDSHVTEGDFTFRVAP